MLNSKLFRDDAKLKAAAVSNSAHVVPGAKGDHVRKIQIALNQLDNAGLDPDGSYGQATAKAVLAFKKKRGTINRSYQTEADNIVGIMTMAALDTEMAATDGSDDEAPLTSRSSGGSCSEGVPLEAKGGSGSDIQPPNPLTVTAVEKLVSKLRIVISAAQFTLNLADPFVTRGKKLTLPTGLFQAPARRAIHLLINVFSMDKQVNPRPGFENIRRVYFNMNVALNRSFSTPPLLHPSFDAPPPIATPLFVANTSKKMEASAQAYTSAGGAFKSSKTIIKGLGVPANQIYVCTKLTQHIELIQISTLIHELAHFVSGQPLKISHEHGVPAQGDMLLDRTALDKLTPEAKLRSPEHYAFFAMAAGSPRLSND